MSETAHERGVSRSATAGVTALANENARFINFCDSSPSDDKRTKVNNQKLLRECNNSIQFKNMMAFPEDKRGLKVTSGVVTIRKDNSNLIGISIGGGAPLCPCVYVVQIFDNTVTSKSGKLESGDEIIGINGTVVKGKTKVEVARLIQASQNEVSITFNKLHADSKDGTTLDIVLKKIKHKIVERMSSETADALGLSRAILCNDSLIKRLDDLDNLEDMFKGMLQHLKRLLRVHFELFVVVREMGKVFVDIGYTDPHEEACKAYEKFGKLHIEVQEHGMQMIKDVHPILGDFKTFVTHAIPDTRLTIKRYADVKFEYLSYCLKVKEMDDEDMSFASMGEPLYRVETGNYEYRLVLRCRALARVKFAQLRSDILAKLELLDNKHVIDTVAQLRRLISTFHTFHEKCAQLLTGVSLFPIELNLSSGAFEYKSTSHITSPLNDQSDIDIDVPDEFKKAASETTDLLNSIVESNSEDVKQKSALEELAQLDITPKSQDNLDDLLLNNGISEINKTEVGESVDNKNDLDLLNF